MSEPTPSAPSERPDALEDFARSLAAACRTAALYPGEHPAVGAALERLEHAIRRAMEAGVTAIGATPTTLLTGGLTVERPSVAVTEAAALLSKRDILELRLVAPPASATLGALVACLTADPDDVRRRGGPKAVWQADGDATMAIEQIDYQRILEAERPSGSPMRRDDIWHSIVRSVLEGRSCSGELELQRLLEIAGEVPAVLDLAQTVSAPYCTPEGAPLLTTQAATVLAAFRQLAAAATLAAPDRVQAICRNLAATVLQLDPHVALELLAANDAAAAGGRLALPGLAAALDDEQVARLLESAVTVDGRATGRLAQVFTALAPDEDRRRRILARARERPAPPGRLQLFRAWWTSLEELVLAHDEKPFVSDAYRSVLDSVVGGARTSFGEAPPELQEWMQTLTPEQVRRASAALLVDLLALEHDPGRAARLVADLQAVAEDLLLAGDYQSAAMAVRTLHAPPRPLEGLPQACAAALVGIARSTAFAEALGLAADLDEGCFGQLAACARAIGAPAVEAMQDMLRRDEGAVTWQRAASMVRSIGPCSAPHLVAFIELFPPAAQVRVARLLGEIADPTVIPLVQPLLRHADLSAVRAGIAALARLDHPAAARAIQTALRASRGERRHALCGTLVGEADRRSVPLLLRMLGESRALGDDHASVLETVTALGALADDRAVTPIAALLQARSWRAPWRTRALRRAVVAALAAIGSPRAAAALDEASRRGGRALRRLVTEQRS